MNVLEFITYCTLKGFVKEHKELEKPSWDVDAEKYFAVRLKGSAYSATIQYVTIGEGAAVTDCSLDDHGHRFADGRHGTMSFLCPELREIIKAFIPDDLA